MAFANGDAADPRMILPRVESLAEQMEDWERRSGATLELGEYGQRHALERVTRTTNQAAVALNSAHDDQDAVQNLRHEFERYRASCADMERRAQQVLAQATQMQQGAAQALAHWRNALHAAQQWLTQARARESQARFERDQAAISLQQAQSALNFAEAELAAARTRTEYVGRDSEGREIYRPVNTVPYQQAVREAESVVARCRNRLAEAEESLRRAVAERQAAEQRVAACTQAVSFAQSALAEAELSVAAAVRARNAAERAFEDQQRAGHFTALSEEKLSVETLAADEAKTQANAAQSSESEAQAALGLADRAHADARLRSTRGRMEIDWRLDQLRAFDAPVTRF